MLGRLHPTPPVRRPDAHRPIRSGADGIDHHQGSAASATGLDVRCPQRSRHEDEPLGPAVLRLANPRRRPGRRPLSPVTAPLRNGDRCLMHERLREKPVEDGGRVRVRQALERDPDLGHPGDGRAHRRRVAELERGPGYSFPGLGGHIRPAVEDLRGRCLRDPRSGSNITERGRRRHKRDHTGLETFRNRPWRKNFRRNDRCSESCARLRRRVLRSTQSRNSSKRFVPRESHMKHAKRSFLVGGIATVAIVLSACGGGSQPGGAGGGANAWTLTGGSEATFRSSFEDWNSANADAEITPEFFANDAYKEKIRTAVGSGNAPTLIYSWAGGALQDYVDNGDVVDLTAATKQLQGRLVPSVLQTGTVDGKVYAVPNNNAQPIVLYTNNKVLCGRRDRCRADYVRGAPRRCRQAQGGRCGHSHRAGRSEPMARADVDRVPRGPRRWPRDLPGRHRREAGRVVQSRDDPGPRHDPAAGGRRRVRRQVRFGGRRFQRRRCAAPHRQGRHAAPGCVGLLHLPHRRTRTSSARATWALPTSPRSREGRATRPTPWATPPTSGRSRRPRRRSSRTPR